MSIAVGIVLFHVACVALVFFGLAFLVVMAELFLTPTPQFDPNLWDHDPDLDVEKANGAAYRATLDWSAGNGCKTGK